MRYLFTYEPPQPNSPSEIVVYQGLASQRDSTSHTLRLLPSLTSFCPSCKENNMKRILLRSHTASSDSRTTAQSEKSIQSAALCEAVFGN
jgi:hypothetical protein